MKGATINFKAALLGRIKKDKKSVPKRRKTFKLDHKNIMDSRRSSGTTP